MIHNIRNSRDSDKCHISVYPIVDGHISVLAMIGACQNIIKTMRIKGKINLSQIYPKWSISKMTNDQMKPGRFERMMRYKRLYASITAAIDKGLTIQVTTRTRSTLYTRASQFKMDRLGVYAQRGKHWDDITGCSIRSVQM